MLRRILQTGNPLIRIIHTNYATHPIRTTSRYPQDTHDSVFRPQHQSRPLPPPRAECSSAHTAALSMLDLGPYIQYGIQLKYFPEGMHTSVRTSLAAYCLHSRSVNSKAILHTRLLATFLYTSTPWFPLPPSLGIVCSNKNLHV